MNNHFIKKRVKIRVYIRKSNSPEDYCGYYDICDCRQDSEAMRSQSSIAYRRRDGRYHLGKIVHSLTGAIGENAITDSVFLEEGILQFAESDEDFPRKMPNSETIEKGNFTIYIENLEKMI